MLVQPGRVASPRRVLRSRVPPGVSTLGKRDIRSERTSPAAGDRRVLAREWKREQESRNLFEQVGAALFGEEDPPVGPAADPVSIPIEQGAVGARRTPAPQPPPA
ncbi:hypothetical protein, partial [Rathayibacter rathayi]|uniref:hypothetical protein n=1 Tax=Rathayibacter rathayi TaxID=33887 RepID=UPI001CA505E2